jgi:meso-butanediol dehydrogenase/(S,S)-butanediol dehydrogenase/diacetyl reductase
MGILDGQVALVTGAGQGSGRGVALALAAEGALVALVGRTESKLQSVASEISGRGSAAAAIRCDVAENEQIDGAVEATMASFGRIDILVNAAHHQVRRGTLLEMSDEDVELLWRTGPRATLRFMRRCYPHMQGGGSVVNFGSSAQMNPPQFGSYAAMKDAIRAISRAAAVEWGPDRIRVNVIAPYTDSPNMIADLSSRGGSSSYSIPLGRVGDAEIDIGRVCVFLASDDASYLTGQFLVLDGGYAYHR